MKLNLTNLFGWEEKNILLLEKLMDEHDVKPDEVLEELDYDDDKLDINSWIYGVLELGAYKMKELMKDYYPQYANEIDDYEVNSYANYCDSGFDSCFYGYNLDTLEVSETKRDQLMKDILNK